MWLYIGNFRQRFKDFSRRKAGAQVLDLPARLLPFGDTIANLTNQSLWQ